MNQSSGNVASTEVPTICPRCYRMIGQTDWCGLCRDHRLSQVLAPTALVVQAHSKTGISLSRANSIREAVAWFERRGYRRLHGPKSVHRSRDARRGYSKLLLSFRDPKTKRPGTLVFWLGREDHPYFADLAARAGAA